MTALLVDKEDPLAGLLPAIHVLSILTPVVKTWVPRVKPGHGWFFVSFMDQLRIAMQAPPADRMRRHSPSASLRDAAGSRT